MITGVKSNVWRKTQGGVYTPGITRAPANARVYMPLWHPMCEKVVNQFTTIDANGWIATVVGATWSIDSGYHFDGTDDYITLHEDTLGGGFSYITIALWWNSDNNWSDAQAANDYLFYKGNINLSDRIGMYLSEADGKLHAWGQYDEGDIWDVESAATSWTAGKWYFTAVTFDGSTWRMYNGDTTTAVSVEADTAASGGGMQAGNGTNGNLYLASVTASLPFDGKIGFFLCYDDVAKTIAEIEAIRLATKWRFM